jgi:hypothetical protein
MGETQQSAVVAGEGRVVDNLKAFLARFEGFKQQQVRALEPIGRFLAAFQTALLFRNEVFREVGG